MLNGKKLNFMRKLLIIVALSLYIGTFAQTSDLLIETICKSNPNKKEIVVDGKIKHNPFYRGYHYDDNSILDMLDEKQQIKGWEFLYSKDRKEMCKLYPFEFNYYIYDAAPNCMVSMYGYGKNFGNVYDKNGQLIYVPYLLRNNIVLCEIEKLVFFKDYQNNKYDILSESSQVQKWIKIILSTKGRLEELKYRFYKTYDPTGWRYVKQLQLDHEDEFYRIYLIERLSNLSFRVVYINKSLKPSHCAIISYTTGSKQFTTDVAVRLAAMPKNIPPVIGVSKQKQTAASVIVNEKDNIAKFKFSINDEAEGKVLKRKKESEEDKVYEVVEQMPEFPGGPQALFEWLSKNIKYPAIAEEKGVQGRVIVTFVVERDGSITDVRVVKSVDPSLDMEAVRVVKSMPRWIPGKQNGSAIRVETTVPITFWLQ